MWHTRAPPSQQEIPALWCQAVAMESFAPTGLRGGLARARTALLAGVPAWMVPQFLDSLQEAGT